MTQYRFRAVSHDDQAHVGEISAIDRSHASRLLLDRGLYPLQLSASENATWFTSAISLRSGRIPASVIVQTLDDLSHLISAGVEVAPSISIVASASTNKHAQKALERMLAAVRGGRALSDATSELGSAYPEHATAILKAAELSGSLSEGLRHVTDGMRRSLVVRTQILTALIYPLCIAGAAIAAVLVLLIVVVPTLESLFVDASSRLPWQTRLLIVVSQGLREHFWILSSILAALFMAAMAGIRNNGMRKRIETLMISLPAVGTVLRAVETAHAARLLSVLTKSQLPLPIAVDLTSRGVRFVLTRDGLEEATQSLRQGEALARALSLVPTFSPRFIALIEIGETTGRLTELLEEAARDAERRVATAVERLLALMTPVLTVLFGAIAAFVLYAVMTAILSVNDLATMGR